MRYRCCTGWLLTAVASGLLAQPAVALAPGVHVNPGSPAGFEYSFPLGSARTVLSRQSSASSPPSASSGSLFGVGIRPAGARSIQARHRGRSGRSPATASSRSGLTGGGRAGAQAGKLATITLDGPLGDLVLPLVGGVLLAGVVAGSLGSLLRRRRLDP